MLKVFSVFSVVFIFTFCMICYLNPNILKKLYSKNLNRLGTWGPISIVQEESFGSIKDIFQAQIVLQVLDRVCGFVSGMLICVLIGRAYTNIHLTSLESSLKESTKQLGELCTQVVELEKSIKTQDSVKCTSCFKTLIFDEESKEKLSKKEFHQPFEGDNNKDGYETLVHRVTEVIKKLDTDESNFVHILEKLINLFQRLSESKATIDKLSSSFESDTTLTSLHKDEVVDSGEYCKKECFEIGNETDNVEEKYIILDQDEDQKTMANIPEEEEDVYSAYPGVRENISYEILLNEPSENSSLMLSALGAGESEETFHAKIVPISQIPKFQDFRKSRKQNPNTLKDHDDRMIPFVTSRNSDQAMCGSGRSTPTSPRIVPQHRGRTRRSKVESYI